MTAHSITVRASPWMRYAGAKTACRVCLVCPDIVPGPASEKLKNHRTL